MKQTVSLWIGNLPEDELQDYLEINYVDNDAESQFMRDFQIDQDDEDFDEDFTEAVALPEQVTTFAELLNGVSYDADVIQRFEKLAGKTLPFPCNAFILQYDFAYHGAVREIHDLTYIGSTEYAES